MADKENTSNPLIDTGNVTVNAFNAIQRADKNTETKVTLGKDDTTPWKSPNFKVKVKAWTSTDKKTHTYFHSLSIDVNVEDFMGTAELKCPYDSDLMKYWEPIRQTVVIYGANRGDYKILFIGRVRGVKQDGYEMVIEFQNYGWKFKQLVTQSYANDNVLNKDGYTIMRLMFEALKIDSWVISESAKKRLKQVGMNQDGNVTMNGKELKKMPDLLKRLKSSDPSKLVSKNSLNDKLREKYLHNIKHINYTLKYEKPTKVMQKIASQGSYTPGENIYANAYASPSAGGSGGAGAGVEGSYSVGGSGKSGGEICPSVPSSQWNAISEIYAFNRSQTDSFTNAYNSIKSFSEGQPNTYFSAVVPCLTTMSKYSTRSDGRNAASEILNGLGASARWNQVTQNAQRGMDWVRQSVGNSLSGIGNAISDFSHNAVNTLSSWGGQVYNALSKYNPFG